ncbi:MAG: glycosyltransferase [Clostridiales Family XIII bacterium]|jgi:glycosyltransferase involved in cell wall biosynthesis|nr:glycosyltransferase [Clostridiales Family XIII bacterium]
MDTKRNDENTIVADLKKALAEKDERLAQYERVIDFASGLYDKEYSLREKNVRQIAKYKAQLAAFAAPKRGNALKRLARLPRRLFRKASGKRGGSAGDKRPQNAVENEGGNVGISVVIATHTSVPSIHKAVESVLGQTFPAGRLEVLIVVNGSDKPYYEELSARYKDEPVVKTLYTERQGLSVARNLGMREASGEFVTFLDDDDYFTPGFLAGLAERVEPDVNIVFGKLFDEHDDGSVDDDTYINLAIGKLGSRKTTDYLKAHSLFGNMAGKLYRAQFFRDNFTEIPEDMSHTEDVMFWAQNFGSLKGQVVAVGPDTDEGYMRMLTDGSMSRPDRATLKSVIEDKLAILRKFTEMFFDTQTKPTHKEFIRYVLIAQAMYISGQCDNDDSGELSETVAAFLRENEDVLTPDFMCPTGRGVAFCQLFPPESDPSANVAAKRLKQISEMEGGRIEWHVIKQDNSGAKKSDELYDQLYASFAYRRKTNLGDSNMSHTKWGKMSYKRMILVRADYIYSRSMLPGTHLAAYQYKLMYPNAKWYAEFSDSLSRDVLAEKRRKRDDLYENIERMVYEKADRIIFTNANQFEYMLSYNPDKELEQSIRERALVMQHPRIDSRYVDLIPSSYTVSEGSINIGYFGNFYINRSHGDMLKLLSNPNVTLHVFTADYYRESGSADIKNDVSKKGHDASRVRVNGSVPYFEMLNIASKMDYLYLQDVDFPGPVNPYLQSKYTDYLVSGSRIIALVRPGSPLAKTENEQLIKTDELTEAFVSSLSARRGGSHG